MSISSQTKNNQSTYEQIIPKIQNQRWCEKSKTRGPILRGETKERIGPESLRIKDWTIIMYITQGLKNKDIAQCIGTTEHVVKNYLRVIYDKLGFSNRLEIALWYVKWKYDHS